MATRRTKSEVYKPLSFEQKHLIELGSVHTQSLHDWVKEATQVVKKKVSPKRHWYIVSPPGLGKTYTIQTTAKANSIDLVMVQGATTLAAFVRKMALAVYVQKVLEKSKKPIFVCVDDCDDLFIDKTGLNVMKGILDNERNVLAWEVDMSGQIQKYRKSESPTTLMMADALEHYQSDGGLGIEVPMDDVIFIIASNKELASDQDAKKKPKLMHEHAVRSRVNYRPINVHGRELWGWAASVILSTDVLGPEHKLSIAQKHILLDWMYSNWERLPGTSLREVQEYAADMLNYPADYTDRWTMRLEK